MPVSKQRSNSKSWRPDKAVSPTYFNALIRTRQRANFIYSFLFSFVDCHRNLFQAALHLFQSHLSSEHLHTYHQRLITLLISYLCCSRHGCKQYKIDSFGMVTVDSAVLFQPSVRVHILHKNKPDLLSYHDSVPYNIIFYS